MSIFSKATDASRARLEQYVRTGLAIDRSDKLYERVSELVLDVTPIATIADQIKQQRPSGLEMRILDMENDRTLFVFGERWKACIEKEWARQDAACYRFWFADPNQKGLNAARKIDLETEMNIVATAIERSFLIINPHTYLCVSIESHKQRDFEIGPKSTRAISGVKTAFGLFSPDALITENLVQVVLDGGDEALSEYLAEMKSDQKLGGGKVGLPLALQYYGTAACPPSATAVVEKALEAKRRSAAPRFCRICGATLTHGAKFCGFCGTATSSTSGMM